MNDFKFEKFTLDELSVIMGGTDDSNKNKPTIIRSTRQVTANADGSLTIITTLYYSDGSSYTETVTTIATTEPGGTTIP